MPVSPIPTARRHPLRGRAFLPLAVSMAALLLAACEPGDRSGTIVGQLYIILASGNEAKIESRPVRLIPENIRLDSALSALCIRRNRAVEALARTADSLRALPASPERDSAYAQLSVARRAATEEAMRDRAAILERRTLRTVQTRPDATFTIDSVAPGKYRLWSDASLRSSHWNWLYPVRVRGGDTVRVSLNNSTIDDEPLKCPTPLGE